MAIITPNDFLLSPSFIGAEFNVACGTGLLFAHSMEEVTLYLHKVWIYLKKCFYQFTHRIVEVLVSQKGARIFRRTKNIYLSYNTKR
jgi:hypothetical protein